METHFEVVCFDKNGVRMTRQIRKGKRITPEVGWALSNGQCHALAIALNEILGWPIRGVYDHEGYHHFIVQTPPSRDTGGLFDADIHGIRCLDWKTRRTSAQAIHRLVKREEGWLVPAMDFARHHAPTVAAALQRQFNGWKVGQPRPKWTLYGEG
jgi:hypothetical protein